MKQVLITIDGIQHSAKCEVGTTLQEFLRSCKLKQIPSLLKTESGAVVVPQYSLAHSWDGSNLGSHSAAGKNPVPALVDSDLLSTV